MTTEIFSLGKKKVGERARVNISNLFGNQYNSILLKNIIYETDDTTIEDFLTNMNNYKSMNHTIEIQMCDAQINKYNLNMIVALTGVTQKYNKFIIELPEKYTIGEILKQQQNIWLNIENGVKNHCIYLEYDCKKYNTYDELDKLYYDIDISKNLLYKYTQLFQHDYFDYQNSDTFRCHLQFNRYVKGLLLKTYIKNINTIELVFSGIKTTFFSDEKNNYDYKVDHSSYSLKYDKLTINSFYGGNNKILYIPFDTSQLKEITKAICLQSNICNRQEICLYDERTSINFSLINTVKLIINFDKIMQTTNENFDLIEICALSNDILVYYLIDKNNISLQGAYDFLCMGEYIMIDNVKNMINYVNN
jgi:hypothetical protein